MTKKTKTKENPRLTREEEIEILEQRNNYILKEGAMKYCLDVEEIYLMDFIGLIFERNGREREEEPFEEIQSPEYMLWLDQKRKSVGEMNYVNYRMWRYNPIVFYQEYENGKKKNKHRIILRDDHESVDFCENRQFAIMSPVTYVGRTRFARNARYLYAFAVDLDGVGMKELDYVFKQAIESKSPHGDFNLTPIPNIIVSSGHGLHLYYLLQQPIALYEDNIPILRKLKYAITNRVWNARSSNLAECQFQGVFQGFRLPGTLTKFGAVIRAFHLPDAPYYTPETLNRYAHLEEGLKKEELDSLQRQRPYDPSSVTLQEAERQWPEWYARKILEGNRLPKKWHIKRDLYDWWLRRLYDDEEKVMPGHRYFCMMALSLYAQKCDIPYDELKADAYGLLSRMENLTNDDDNHFTTEDIDDALRAYNESYNTFPRNSIEYLTALSMPVNKRNKRPQGLHLQIARGTRDIVALANGKPWDWNKGRRKEDVMTSVNSNLVIDWIEENPGKSMQECAKELGLSRQTVAKWWKANGEKNSKEQAVITWRAEHPEGNKSKCSIDLGFSHHTVSKYWK